VTAPRAEIEAAVERYLQIRSDAEEGRSGWDALDEMFTDDATFIDPAWGRVTGIDNLRHFWRESMAGLDDWRFPNDWATIDGDQVVLRWWNRLPGQRDDGTYYEVPGVSTLTYAGDGKFSYEEDLINMVHLIEIITESGYRFPANGNPPPRNPPR
jgi:ketosteroid isomerase-like protein